MCERSTKPHGWWHSGPVVMRITFTCGRLSPDFQESPSECLAINALTRPSEREKRNQWASHGLQMRKCEDTTSRMKLFDDSNISLTDYSVMFCCIVFASSRPQRLLKTITCKESARLNHQKRLSIAANKCRQTPTTALDHPDVHRCSRILVDVLQVCKRLKTSHLRSRLTIHWVCAQL